MEHQKSPPKSIFKFRYLKHGKKKKKSNKIVINANIYFGHSS